MIKPIRKRRRLLALSIAATAITVTSFTIPAAQAADPNTAEGAGYTVEPVGDPFEDAYTIEPGTYPGADKIAAQKKILLKDGDGQIMLAECGSAPNQINIRSVVAADLMFCFNLSGPTGWLKMEITGSYIARATEDKNLSVKATDVQNREILTEVPKGENRPIRSAGATVTVVELRVNPQ